LTHPGAKAQLCSVYGLGLELNVPIAGLAGLEAPDHVDVTMRLGQLPPGAWDTSSSAQHYVSTRRDPAGLPTLHVTRTPDDRYFVFAYRDGTRIVVAADGDAVWATWPPAATVEDTATYLLGPTLGFVLRVRGVTCLHASAVVIDGKAVALVGEASAGKSSTAAAFARAGHAVLSDDVVALDDRGDSFLVQPAYPRVRLWDDAVRPLFGSADALPRITPTWEKRYLDLNAPGYHFQHEALPLAAIYLLGERVAPPAAPAITEVAPREALMGLVANTYANYLLDAPQRAVEFEALGRLVRHVPVRSARASSEFSRIGEFCEHIVADVRQQPRP
jgi:hypothetical protein